MRYFEVPRRRTNSGASRKGKRLAYSSFDEGRQQLVGSPYRGRGTSTFGSPVPGSSLDGLDVQVFGLDVQELSTHPGAPLLLSTGLLLLSSSQHMLTGCSSAVRMDREVDSDELALMLPTNSGQLKSSSLGVWHQRCH